MGLFLAAADRLPTGDPKISQQRNWWVGELLPLPPGLPSAL